MSLPKRIAIVKTGWSEDYQGGQVSGDYGYVQEYKEGHERFNFLAGPTGRFHAYLPPLGGGWLPPNPVARDDWFLIFVSKKPKTTGLLIVGWYEHATFEEAYADRPEYALGVPFEHDSKGDPYRFVISAPSAVVVPTPLRVEKLKTNRIKTTPLAYLAGNEDSDAWRKALAKSAMRQIDRLKLEIERDGWGRTASGRFTSPDAEHRKAVEEAAMTAVEAELRRKGYDVSRVHLENRGYDLLAQKRGDELHVEVKGTSGSVRQFLISRKEHDYMAQPNWRLGLVTLALSKPSVEILNAADARKAFVFEAFTWQAREKK